MEYVEKHKSATEVSKKDSENHKYIVYVSGGNDGYGNRLPGVAMAFLWALLTDRVLLVHWRDTFPNPASWGKLFQPGVEMDVDKLRDSLSDKILQYVPFGSSASCGNSNKKGSSSNSGCAMVVRDDYAKIASKDLNQQYPEKVLLFKSDDYAMPLLVNNENYKDQVKSLFNNKHANVFGHIARWLLTPSPKIQKTVDRTFESLGKYNFGMHLRMQKPMPAGGDKGVKVPDPEVFFKFARMRAEALGFPASDTVFYLASDDSRARDRATRGRGRRDPRPRRVGGGRRARGAGAARRRARPRRDRAAGRRGGRAAHARRPARGAVPARRRAARRVGRGRRLRGGRGRRRRRGGRAHRRDRAAGCQSGLQAAPAQEVGAAAPGGSSWL